MIFKPGLYIVSTPIGNLEDITYRAIRILKESDLIIVENIQKSLKLLNYFKIKSCLETNNMHNEHKKLSNFILKLQCGKIISLISNAGTPGISDPGYILIRSAIQNNIIVECIPGATAFLPALVLSSFPMNEFIFVGFLPKKGRLNKIKSLTIEIRTMIFYESRYKLISTLKEFIDCFGKNRQISLTKELSKIYEYTFRGTLEEVLVQVTNKLIKGEFVLCVSGKNYKLN